MSVSQNYPIIAPSLSLDFANVQALDPRITFARATTATYYGTRTALAEQNLMLQSQTFETTWNAVNATVGVNSTIAPDGTTTAESFTPTATSGTHSLQQSAGTIGVQCTFSVFAKSNGYTNIQLFADSSGNFNATFDLTAGTAASTGGAVVSIVNVGSGWYRCIATFTQTASTRLNISGFPTGATASNFGNTFTGDGTSGVFLWGAQLEQRSTVTAYTPTTTQPITNYIPVLETAAAGVARFDHNPVTFESLGLLIEEQRTNLFTYSEQFDNAFWTKSNASITINTVVAPDSTLSADKLFENSTLNQHAIFNFSTTVAAGSHTFSVFAKAGERNWIKLGINSTSGVIGAFFNLSTGAVGTVESGVTQTITPVGNNWYRCTVTATASAGASGGANVYLATGNNTLSYTGDGYSGIYIWGAQLEAGSFPTSYIKTVASQVTRAADSASMTGSNFSEWYRQDEGTLYANFATPSITGNVVEIRADSGNTDFVRLSRSSNNGYMRVFANSVGQADLFPVISGSWATGVQLVGAYKINDFAAVASGQAVATDTSGLISTNITNMNIGVTGGGGNINGTIKKLSYYPIRLSNLQLQSLTS